MSSVYVIVHCDGAITNCPNEEVTFTSPSSNLVSVRRGITLQALKKVIHKKLRRDRNERVSTIHLRYPIRLGPGVTNYTAVELNDDEDVQAIFNIHDSIQAQAGIELYVTFDSCTSSFSKPQPHLSPSPYPTHHALQSPLPTENSNWENDIHSYTQLLTGPFINLSQIESPPIQQSPPEEHAIVGLPTESFDPFSEDEDEILAQCQEDEQDQHTNPISTDPPSPPSQTHVPYNPPPHFLNFPTDMHAYDLEFGHVLDRECPVYPPGTLFVGQRFTNKEQVVDAINRFHIMNHCTYKVKSSSTTRLMVHCVHDECDWTCRAILRTKEQYWEIMKVEGHHTCVSPLIG